MSKHPGCLRRYLLLLTTTGALLGLVLAVASAVASPAENPPIEPQSPAEGASVPATGEGIKVTFTCPSFVLEEGEEIEQEPEEGEEVAPPPIVLPPVLGNGENYVVHFSTSPDVNSSGQLGTTGLGEAAKAFAEPIKGSAGLCTSTLFLPTAPTPAALFEGKVYWQVYRESGLVADGIEVGPVRSFTVFPHVEEPSLVFNEQIFAGYLTKVKLFYEAELGGAVVQLQMWEGSAWKTIAEAPGSNRYENTFFIKLKKPGRTLFRPLVIGPGPALGLEPTSRVIRKPTKQRVTSAAEDGSYQASSKKEREEAPISLTVKGGGTSLVNLSAETEMLCKGPTKAQNVTLIAPAHLRNAKIAPDGTVFGVTKTKGPEFWTVTLSGSLFQGRFQGELLTSRENCTGYRRIDAVLTKGGKQG